MTPNILFFGDNHGHFRHIIAAVEREKPDAIVLLGDIEASRPLEVELAPIVGRTVVLAVPGNHEADDDRYFRNVFNSGIADVDLHGRVRTVAGIRIAGLGGVFRGKVWMPPAQPIFDSYDDWVKASQRALRKDECDARQATAARTHQTSIFWDVYSRLWEQRADVLVTHEAPSVHPYGFEAIDDLARAMGVHATFHGHHHDALNYRDEWDRIGFKAYGVGFCGITDLDGRIVRPGDFDGRATRS